MQVFSRNNNDTLFNMMRSLIPVECKSVTGFNKWFQAADYLYFIIDKGDGWIVNCDIDCFIYDWQKVEQIIEQMKAGGYTHAGAHDGGEMPGRSRSWVCMNPFFNIFNATRIRELKGKKGWNEIKRAGFKSKWDVNRPDYLGPNINHVRDEPFHGFFYWLYDVGKPYFIRTSPHSDGISTDTGFALHSWYSRRFHIEAHNKRIISLYEEAKYNYSLQK